MSTLLLKVSKPLSLILILTPHFLSLLSPGPMPNTIADLWRMVWEYKIEHIVMLTKCLEAGRVGHHLVCCFSLSIHGHVVTVPLCSHQFNSIPTNM